MATTVTAPVNNNITLAEKYLPLLDEIYKRGALTSVLDTPADRVKWTGANTANIFNLDIAGLGNYSRNAGFVPGDVTGTWEPYKLEIDRGRSYMVDAMDDEETLGMAFGSLVGETERRIIIPEVDAYRFAKLAGTEGILKGTATTITKGSDVAAMIDDAEAAMNDEEVPTEGRILFLSSTAYKALRANITRTVQTGEGNVNNMIEVYNDMRVVTVPQARFNTAVTLNAPTGSGEIGGFTATGKDINFMIVHPSAVLSVVKHAVPRIFSPAVNQEADAWKFDFRVYHDIFVKKNHVKGIYLSAAE